MLVQPSGICLDEPVAADRADHAGLTQPCVGQHQVFSRDINTDSRLADPAGSEKRRTGANVGELEEVTCMTSWSYTSV